MKKIAISVSILLLFITSTANSQSYSNLPPSVVGQPAVAIHQRGDNSAQVYQYGNPISLTPAPAPQPSTNFVYDAGTGNSQLQFNNSGATIIFPLNKD
jgi:hypothetical protein